LNFSLNPWQFGANLFDFDHLDVFHSLSLHHHGQLGREVPGPSKCEEHQDEHSSDKQTTQLSKDILKEVVGIGQFAFCETEFQNSLLLEGRLRMNSNWCCSVSLDSCSSFS